MMDKKYEESVWSILRGRDGFAEQLDAISEFKEQLNDAALAEEKLDYGWVLWREQEELDLDELHHHHSNSSFQHKIITLFKHIASDPRFFYHYMAQFWAAAVVEVEGQHRRQLSTSDQPFSVGNLTKGLCWYRKLCMNHVYDVQDGGDEEQLGGVGRAYRNKHPESTPDLRLYSSDEFPLHDQAARCGLRGYLTLPIFDVHSNECYGVLELVSGTTIVAYQLSPLDTGLQIAGLRSTHINFIPFSQTNMPDKYRQQPESEITEMLELAIKKVPQLYLAQVWVSCKQCANMSSNLSCICMERTSFINGWDKRVNLCNDIDDDMFLYLQACEFHNLQLDLNYFNQNLCDLSISKNPLAHHAKKARLFLCFAICLQSESNGSDRCVVEFFLGPKCREDGSSLHWLLKIVEMKLKSLKFVSREQLPPELVAQTQSNANECDSIDMLNVMMNSYMESFSSELDFTKHMEAVDSCCLQPSSEDSGEGWVFGRPAGDNEPQILVKEKITHFMKKMAAKFETKYSILQFWEPNKVEGRCYLETSDQPYALGSLVKGLASFRKKCMKHRYLVDEEAKQEELGPLGRVFRNSHPEITLDLFLYSEKEFPMRNYAVHCGFQEYFALPVFDIDEHNHKCVGVLELLGFSYSELKGIRGALEETRLCSTHIDFSPSFLENDKPANITNCRDKALMEVREAFLLITHIPQLHMAKVFVPYEKCDSPNSNARCMELALSTKHIFIFEYIPKKLVHWTHVQPGKGIIGMVLESESKSCFCRNLCEFDLVDQPLAHYVRRERLDVCFAICLQSSHTGDLLYVLEFFLNQSPRYLVSFLNFLLPIMKHQLKSFKYASGKQLDEELVVEVIEFSKAETNLLSQLGQSDVFPIKFKSVQYGQMEHQQAEDESCSTAASDLEKTKRPKRKTGFHLSFEKLEPHFGKKLKDAAEELGVGRSTIKRACRDHGIDRWPCKEKHTRNPSLYEKETDQDSQQLMRPSSSSSLQLSGTSNVPQHLVIQEEAENVMVKVRYEEDIIRFEMCLSSGVSKLFEEVAKGLNLNKATFKLKYLDEDNDEILLNRDADLQLCPKSRTTTGKTCIRLFVQLISK